jgi:hypothetical protein
MVYWQPDPGNPGERKPSNKDVIEAAMNVVMIDLALLSAEMTAGIYRKPIDEIAKTFQYEPLPPEVRQVIVAAWIRGGLLPPSAIKAMVPRREPETIECPTT